MQFLKKNYEKIVLGVVVLAALVVVAFLPITVSREKQQLTDMESNVLPPNPKALPPLDLTRVDELVKRGATSVSLNLADAPKIFNPVRWQLKADRTLFRNPAGEEVKGLKVTRISPLYETYSLVSASASAGLATHYGIGIKHEAADTVARRNIRINYVSINQTTNNFTVIAAEGPEEDPTSVTLRLTDTQITVKITKEKPYQRVEGYTADLVYTSENKSFLNRRKTDSSSISFANESYKIVDIEESEVVLLQLSNQKQWIREFNPSNSTVPAN